MTVPYLVSVLSGKGGVGKTTISLNLARWLSRFRTVWLVDFDLFNRGATSALWESERDIQLSVTELIALHAGRADSRDIFAASLVQRMRLLEYSSNLYALPAARAREGRDAAYAVWRSSGADGGESAEGFLAALLYAIQKVTPAAIVVIDGHGGLDHLSIASAVLSDLTYIVNEPDLITFTGSVLLFNEVLATSRVAQREPLIEFIINRVPERRSIYGMERDFGDALRTMSASKNPVAAYFPLEKELFSVFGDDPFVAEIYSEYWFSKKIELIGSDVLNRGSRSGAQPLQASPASRLQEAPRRKRRAIRGSLRRPLHQRGDLLLYFWLGWGTLVTNALLWRATSDDFAVAGFFRADDYALLPRAVFTVGVWLDLLTIAVAVFLLTQSRRWLGVQRLHLRNARRIRALHGRRIAREDSKTAKLRRELEQRAERRTLRRGLRVGVFLAVMFAVFAALLVPNFLDSLARAKEKRTMADMRNIGTAMMAWLVDQVDDPEKSGASMDMPPTLTCSDLRQVLTPIYIFELDCIDPWGNPYEFRLNSAEVFGERVLAIRSAGPNGSFDAPNPYYEDAGDDISWADGYFVAIPASAKLREGI